MILKLRIVMKEQIRDLVIETEMVVETEEHAHAAGEEFWKLSLAAFGGVDEALGAGS